MRKETFDIGKLPGYEQAMILLQCAADILVHERDPFPKLEAARRLGIRVGSVAWYHAEWTLDRLGQRPNDQWKLHEAVARIGKTTGAW